MIFNKSHNLDLVYIQPYKVKSEVFLQLNIVWDKMKILHEKW